MPVLVGYFTVMPDICVLIHIFFIFLAVLSYIWIFSLGIY